MRVPGIHALLTTGVAVLATAGTVSAVSLTAAGDTDGPPLPPARPATVAPPAPAVPPAPPPDPAPGPTSGSGPGSDTGDSGSSGSSGSSGTGSAGGGRAEYPRPADPQADRPAPDRDEDTPEDGTADGTADGGLPPRGRPDDARERREQIDFACEQGWFSGEACRN